MPWQDCRLLGISEDRKKNVCQKTNSSSSSKYKRSSNFIKRCLGSASSSNHPIAFFKDVLLRCVLHKFPVFWHTVQCIYTYARLCFQHHSVMCLPSCCFLVTILARLRVMSFGWYLIEANCILSLCRLHLVWDDQPSQGTLSHGRSNSLGLGLGVEIARPLK